MKELSPHFIEKPGHSLRTGENNSSRPAHPGAWSEGFGKSPIRYAGADKFFHGFGCGPEPVRGLKPERKVCPGLGGLSGQGLSEQAPSPRPSWPSAPDGASQRCRAAQPGQSNLWKSKRIEGGWAFWPGGKFSPQRNRLHCSNKNDP